jgi:hypothetical protein
MIVCGVFAARLKDQAVRLLQAAATIFRARLMRLIMTVERG